MTQIDLLREQLARITRRGIGMPIAGGVYWLVMAGLGAYSGWGDRLLSLALFFGTGAIFPLGWALTRAFGGDLMEKRHPLAGLGMTLNFVQLAYWPVVIAVFARDPRLVPLAMGALFGSHFLPYGWLYRSRGYAALGIGSVVVATALHLLAPASVFTVIPLGMAACYFVAAVLIAAENRRTAALAPG